MTKPLTLGLAGLGTVGVGVVKLLQQNADLYAARTGRRVELRAVTARSKDKDRGVDLSGYDWEDDAVSLAKRDDIDVFVEVMGGSEGAAKDATLAALASGKDVVSANKALLALHGQQIAQMADDAGRSIRYEAAVAGGIPVIKSLAEGLAGNRMTRVMGVMNGTCNYILTRMESAGLSYDEVFAEADQLGYLEADPTLDVGGIDAGHKLALLVALAFGTQVDFDGVELEGIQQITARDIHHAADLGYRIKLLGVAQMTDAGLEQRMSPCLVPAASPLGQLEGGTNMCVLEGDAVQQVVLRGPGAGEGPTASAVLGDILDLARGIRIPAFGVPAAQLKAAPSVKSAVAAPYYLRLELRDEPGALARMAQVLAEHGISIDRMRQREHSESPATVLIVTHAVQRSALDAALADLPQTGVLGDTPLAIRIEKV